MEMRGVRSSGSWFAPPALLREQSRQKRDACEQEEKQSIDMGCEHGESVEELES